MINFKLLYILAFVHFSIQGRLDVDELRNVIYDPDISETPSGVDPGIDLSHLDEKKIEEFRQRVLAKYPKRDDGSFVFITSRTGQEFACGLPQLNALPKEPEESFNPKYLAEIVSASFYVKNCITKDTGWWSYEVCRGKFIRQTHGAKNEAVQVENSLGLFTGKYGMPEFTKSTADKLLYFEEYYESGSICEVDDKRVTRKTTVRYTCDPLLSTSEAVVDAVDEDPSCVYTIHIRVGSLCKIKSFSPPSHRSALQITCQPYVPIEKLNNYLDNVMNTKHRMKEGKKASVIAGRAMKAAQRRRAAMRRTELLRHSKAKRSAVREIFDREHLHASMDYLRAVYISHNGKDPDDSALANLETLALAMDDIELVFYDYDSELDEERGQLWFYFHDPLWKRNYYPKSLVYVDTMNAYFEAITEKMMKAETLIEINELNEIRFGDPFIPKENILVGGNQISAAIESDPQWFLDTIKERERKLEGKMTKPIHELTILVEGLSIMKGFEDTVLINFLNFLKEGLENGSLKLEEYNERELAIDIATFHARMKIQYLMLVDIVVEEIPMTEESIFKEAAEDLLKHVLVVEYVHQFISDKKSIGKENQRKFAAAKEKELEKSRKSQNSKEYDWFDDDDDDDDKKEQEELDETQNLLRFVKRNFEAVSAGDKPRIEKYYQLMKKEVNTAYYRAFLEVWYDLADSLLMKKRRKDQEKRSSSKSGAMSHIPGRVIVQGPTLVTQGFSLLELLSAAGLGDTKMKIEVVSVNGVEVGEDKKLRDDVQAFLEAQNEDLKDIKKAQHRQKAYNHVLYLGQ